MKRSSITLSEAARKIYESWPSHERSKMVSDAIMEKWERDNGKLFTDAEKEEIRRIAKEEIRRYEK